MINKTTAIFIGMVLIVSSAVGIMFGVLYSKKPPPTPEQQITNVQREIERQLTEVLNKVDKIDRMIVFYPENQKTSIQLQLIGICGRAGTVSDHYSQQKNSIEGLESVFHESFKLLLITEQLERKIKEELKY